VLVTFKFPEGVKENLIPVKTRSDPAGSVDDGWSRAVMVFMAP
jgi:hypothetical protein